MPSASSATSDAWSPSNGGASTTTSRAPRGMRRNPVGRRVDARERRRRAFAGVRLRRAASRDRTRPDDGCQTRAPSACGRSTSPGQASASASASANSTGRRASGTLVLPARTTRRQASTTSASEARRAATVADGQCLRADGTERVARRDLPLPARAAVASATSAGIPARRAACSARSSAGVCGVHLQRPQRDLCCRQLRHREERRRQSDGVEGGDDGRGAVELAEQ